MSRVTRKPAFCICGNKGEDQLCGKRAGDQRLCFRDTDRKSLCFLNTKLLASIHPMWLYIPVYVGPGRKSRRQVFSRRGSICPRRHRTYYMSRVTTKPIFGVSDQVPNKLGCTATKDGLRLRKKRGCTIYVAKTKGADQLW